jgi:hypothetical protein
MNWKLIVALSMFGLVMAIGTISMIPMHVEYFLWPVIFILCALIIAKNAPSKFFLHGFLVCILNCVWITAAHAIFFNSYMMHHPEMAQMKMPMPDHPRRMMVLFGPVVGVVSGIIVGSLSWLASKIFKR